MAGFGTLAPGSDLENILLAAQNQQAAQPPQPPPASPPLQEILRQRALRNFYGYGGVVRNPIGVGIRG